MNEALRAQGILAERFGVAAEVWSATSYPELYREAVACEEFSRRSPELSPRVPYVTRMLEPADGPVVAVSDYLSALPALIGRWVPGPFTVLGTDGFGRSDTRPALRRHFRVDAEEIAGAVLAGLSRMGRLSPETAAAALEELGLVEEQARPVPLA